MGKEMEREREREKETGLPFATAERREGEREMG